jgi:hypothetical protein
MFDVPPPGAGLTTVIAAVPVLATSVEVIAACNFLSETKVVALGDPFQFTVDPATNPVPCTFNVNPLPPLPRLAGLSGLLRNGLGLSCAKRVVPTNAREKNKNLHFDINCHPEMKVCGLWG